MKKLVVVSLMLASALALAQNDSNNEAWIPLEDLDADDQAKALDAEEVDRAKREAAPAWSEVTDQLVIHALYNKALLEAGSDLLGGIR